MDPENAAPEYACFLKTGLRVEKSENAALLFSITKPLELLPPTSEPRDVS